MTITALLKAAAEKYPDRPAVTCGQTTLTYTELVRSSSAAAVALPDEEWGEAIAAVIVLHPGSAVSVEELQGLVRGRLRSFRVPALIEVRDKLPCNDLGKVLRRILRDEPASRS